MFVTVKLACAFDPRATPPKLRTAGRTVSCGGVTPEPVTTLVELPPLLLNTTTLLKLEALDGAKLIDIRLVWPARMMNGLSDWTANGSVVTAVPVRGRSPVLTSWKVKVLVRPRVIEPKARLAGLTMSCGGELVVAT